MRNFDRVAKIYDSTRGLPSSVMPAVVEALASELRGSRLVLDAGTGTGRFASPLQERGFDVVGLDVSQAMMDEARGKGVRGLVRAGLERMPFGERSFDSCVMVHVLHLMNDPNDLISEVTRVCRSRVVSLVETSDGVSVRDLYLELRSELGVPWRGFSERELGELLPPSSARRAAAYSEEVRAEDDVAYFRDRLSAVTWDVPRDIHEEIVGRLAARVAGRSVSTRVVDVVSWETELLRTVTIPR